MNECKLRSMRQNGSNLDRILSYFKLLQIKQVH